MALLTKDGVRFSVRDKNHLSAFLNNGWVVDNPTQKAEKEPDDSNSEKHEDADAENAGKQYTKSDITHMSTADLKTLAPTLGIEVTEESTGAKLKEEIVAKLGL